MAGTTTGPGGSQDGHGSTQERCCGAGLLAVRRGDGRAEGEREGEGKEEEEEVEEEEEKEERRSGREKEEEDYN